MNQRSTSPLSEDLSESAMTSLQRQGKSNMKPKFSSQSTNNNISKDGYIPINRQNIHQTGLRGRKTFAFWTLICLLFILAIGNLILIVTILGVLRLGQGMESLELLQKDSTIKLYNLIDLDRIYKPNGKIEGFADTPVVVTLPNGSFLINFFKHGRPYSKLKLDNNGTQFKSMEHFEVTDFQTGNSIFQTEFPHFELNHGANNFNSKRISTNRVSSPIDKDLHLRSDGIGNLQGTEGTHMESKEILWSADQDIFLKSVNGSLVLSGVEGVFIDMKNIPIATDEHGHLTQNAGHFKVCVCMPQGKLFRVPVPKGHNSRISCAHVNMSPTQNPCI